ncbi:MAG: hypothetical protein R3185_03815 [Candidatus Thermoplasmatota archaeon]|nr:hypothetical protein [Candidatus Thermoplasmatota archaeon]
MTSMLEFHPIQEHQVAPARMAELLQQAKEVLQDQGMASIDEYGDMLEWVLPRTEETWRKLHVFHPGFCSYSDAYWGTIHYHTGRIRGTVLAGHMEHYTYEAVQDPQGDRFHDGQAYTLTKHTHPQGAGTAYELDPMVAHWLKPTTLTLTYFEEEVTAQPADLVNPASEEIDEHAWDQAQADALLPEVLELIDAELAALTPKL